MNFKQLKPETRAALREASVKIRSMQSSMQSTSAQATTLASASQKSWSSARQHLRVGRQVQKRR